MFDTAYLKSKLPVMEKIIDQNCQRLLEPNRQSEEPEDELLNPKFQGLQRLLCQEFRLYMTMLKVTAPSHDASDKNPIDIPATWRDNPALFAKEALHLELYDHQKKFCASRKRINLLIAGRGAGKSLAACVIAIERALAHPRHTVLVVSSGQRMSSDFGGKILDLLRESPIRPWVTSISNEQVIFKNRSTIKLLPANPDTIRGYHPKTPLETQTSYFSEEAGITVILDEACFMEQGDEIRKAVEYALITTPHDQGRLYIVSSPSTTGSWVYNYAMKSREDDPDTEVIQCPSTANPNITPEEIERLRSSKNELEFRAEVLGEWVEGAYGLFNGLIEPNLVPSDNFTPPKYALCALGADLALSYDRTHDRNALAVVTQWWPDDDPDGEAKYRLLDLIVLEQASDKELRATLKRLIEQYAIECADIEQYQGKGLAEYCQSLGVNTQLIAPTSGAQQTAFHELHRLLRQNLLQLPCNLPPILFDELKTFEYQWDATGKISFGHPTGGHDDTVYALAWAIHAAQFIPPPDRPISLPPRIEFIPKT